MLCAVHNNTLAVPKAIKKSFYPFYSLTIKIKQRKYLPDKREGQQLGVLEVIITGINQGCVIGAMT